jgi:hypothetical protein
MPFPDAQPGGKALETSMMGVPVNRLPKKSKPLVLVAFTISLCDSITCAPG